MGLVVMLKHPGDKFSKMFTKEYCCTKCQYKVGTFENSWPIVYHCDHCGRTACNPRVCYRLKDEYKDMDMIETLLNDLYFFDGCFYYGKLATYVAVLDNFYSGGEGVAGRVNDYSLEDD